MKLVYVCSYSKQCSQENKMFNVVTFKRLGQFSNTNRSISVQTSITTHIYFCINGSIKISASCMDRQHPQQTVPAQITKPSTLYTTIAHCEYLVLTSHSIIISPSSTPGMVVFPCETNRYARIPCVSSSFSAGVAGVTSQAHASHRGDVIRAGSRAGRCAPCDWRCTFG